MKVLLEITTFVVVALVVVVAVVVVEILNGNPSKEGLHVRDLIAFC